MARVTSRALAAPVGDPVIALLLRQLHRAFDVRSWHDTNLMGSLRGLDRELLVYAGQIQLLKRLYANR